MFAMSLVFRQVLGDGELASRVRGRARVVVLGKLFGFEGFALLFSLRFRHAPELSVHSCLVGTSR